MSALVGEAIAVAAHRLGPDAADVLARLGGGVGEDARTAFAELTSLDATASKRRRAEIMSSAYGPVPSNLRMIHSSWIEMHLAELGARARTAVAAPTSAPIDVWLARWATAALPPMPSAPRTPLDRVLLRDAASVIDWLAAIGADQLAFALGAAAAAHRSLAPALARIGQPPRLGALGAQRAAIARCSGVSLDDPTAFVIVGTRALAPHLADHPLARLQLVHRLPRPVGVVVAGELAAHATASLESAPTWAALS